MARRGGRGFNRQVRRKFVWDRSEGVAVGDSTSFGVDLLANFRSQPGATHLGATIMRIRGYVYPQLVGAPDIQRGIFGFRVDTWDQPVDTNQASPYQGMDEDWMGWFPFMYDQAATQNEQDRVATWNSEANIYAIDVKAGRKLEELNQTLWMFYSAGGGESSIVYHYNLSVGLKLA